jgi:GTPase SAR1 family protein
VGKTCLVHRFVRGAFLGPATATIGAAFMKKDVLVGNQLVVLQIWDTAGQERFRSMVRMPACARRRHRRRRRLRLTRSQASMYYRGAHAAVLVFDATQPALHEVENWVGELQQHVPSCALVMAANKSDLPVPEAAALQREASNFAAEIGAQLFATSAKTGQGAPRRAARPQPPRAAPHARPQASRTSSCTLRVSWPSRRRSAAAAAAEAAATATRACDSRIGGAAAARRGGEAAAAAERARAPRAPRRLV